MPELWCAVHDAGLEGCRCEEGRMFEDRRVLIGESESGTPIWFDVSPADLISKMLAGRPSIEEGE